MGTTAAAVDILQMSALGQTADHDPQKLPFAVAVRSGGVSYTVRHSDEGRGEVVRARHTATTQIKASLQRMANNEYRDCVSSQQSLSWLDGDSLTRRIKCGGSCLVDWRKRWSTS